MIFCGRVFDKDVAPLALGKVGRVSACSIPFFPLVLVSEICQTPAVALNMNRRIAFQTAAALALVLCLTGRAGDWPQWHGPNRDNVWSETGIMESFPTEGLKIRWRVPVGPGWSSPVVVGGRVYLTDMRLDKPRAWERVQCFKESNRKLLWSHEAELVCPEWALSLSTAAVRRRHRSSRREGFIPWAERVRWIVGTRGTAKSFGKYH